MADKKIVGTFQSETQVLNKIDELKAQGYTENEIYIVTNDADTLSIVRGETDVELRSPEGNWMDKFLAFLSGDEPVKGAFTKMGFTEEESNRYFDEVKAGGILLYVDREFGDLSGNLETEYQTGYTDPNIGSNLVVDDYDNPNLAMNSKGLNTDVEREERLRLHEEKLNVDKKRYQAGEVNVNKRVVKDTQTVEVPVTREEVYIQRRAVTDETAAGKVFDDGKSIHIPVMEERVEVTKRPIVSEEIIVGKREVHDTETVNETMRREKADIDRSDGVLDDHDGTVNDSLETNQFESNELDYDPLKERNRF
ncbi:YsnF/AvaK domain-containing protein [Sporosarcina sp. ANT_H38]|uniref:YsnF/AvaK domain-containing protein n=1 Tax=Sporosarcina sp. ANT_H38 TaxID=2597358 RepID=UPI0011F2A3D7|nr:YsnF/AvaK domain-containing protein [Sporosarcina sp. ANT_H38]KAA0966199.1 YsnF/AvaK domain-containing protein [Sporosarcina sp. ANT_H38]